MRVVYLAHPVSGDVARNLANAREWIRFIERTTAEIAIVANWIIECEIFDDSIPDERAAGMRRNMAVIARCDELWMVGGRVSDGMAAEQREAERLGITVRDFTPVGYNVPRFG